jgi:hypothetical protein
VGAKGTKFFSQFLCWLWIRIDLKQILIQHFFQLLIRVRMLGPDPDPVPDPGFDDRKLKRIYSPNFLFFIKNFNLLYLSHLNEPSSDYYPE